MASARYGSDFSFILDLANNGLNDAALPAVLINSPNGAPLSTTSPVPGDSVSYLQVFPVGSLNPDLLTAGEHIFINLNAKATQLPSTLLRVSDLSFSATLIDWPAQEPYYRDTSTQEEWNRTWSNFVATAGATWESLYQALRTAAYDLSPPASGEGFFTANYLVQQLMASARGSPLGGPAAFQGPSRMLNLPPGCQDGEVVCGLQPDCCECNANADDLVDAYTDAQRIAEYSVPFFGRTYIRTAIYRWLSGGGSRITYGPMDQLSRDFANHSVTRSFFSELVGQAMSKLQQGQYANALQCGETRVFQLGAGANVLNLDNVLVRGACANALEYRDGRSVSSLLGGVDCVVAVGSVEVRKVCDQQGCPQSAEYAFHIFFNVKDVFDFCPRGGSFRSEWMNQRILCQTMEQLEGCGVARDVQINFTTPEISHALSVPFRDGCMNPPVNPPGAPGGPGGPGPGDPNDPGGPGNPGCTGDLCSDGEVPTVRPIDPNEIVGPSGFGPFKFVGTHRPLLYTVRFENLADASAATREIHIIGHLGSILDARSVRLKEIGFGTYRVSVPPDQSFYRVRLTLGPSASNLLADITAFVDVQANEVRWTLRAIDPATGELPERAQLGLLLPNDVTHRGEGFVSYTVLPTEGPVTGTLVTNTATIVFDNNEPFDTGPVWNTLDSAAPSSAVSAISPVSLSDFSVTVTGMDDLGGSGLQSFDIYVSDNGGPFQLWITGTTARTVFYSGQPGHTYRFYSRAHDNVGNVEYAPPTHDAQTTVLPAVAVQVVNVGETLMVTNSAPGLDSGLTWGLLPGAPTGARINTTNGVFVWTPQCTQGSSTNVITVLVTNMGSSTVARTFTVIVPECVEVGLGSTAVRVGQQGCVTNVLFSTVDLTNLTFTTEFPSNRFTRIFHNEVRGAIFAAEKMAVLVAMDPWHAPAGQHASQRLREACFGGVLSPQADTISPGMFR